MNKLITFMFGSASTYIINSGLMNFDNVEEVVSYLMSIVGGVLSTIIVSWLRKRWDNLRKPGSMK